MPLRQDSGKLGFLRVHNVGEKFGPPADKIDVEVVMRLAQEPQEAYGFQLRNDQQRAAREGMLALLRDAFNHNWTVTVDYNIPEGKRNGVIIRVALTK